MPNDIQDWATAVSGPLRSPSAIFVDGQIGLTAAAPAPNSAPFTYHPTLSVANFLLTVVARTAATEGALLLGLYNARTTGVTYFLSTLVLPSGPTLVALPGTFDLAGPLATAGAIDGDAIRIQYGVGDLVGTGTYDITLSFLYNSV
jgi:hypothetical protein